MLTKTDLKQIDGFISKRLNGVAMREDLRVFATKEDLKDFITKVEFKKELKPIKSGLSKIQKNIDVVIRMFDRVEDHLHLPPMSSQF